MFVVFKYYSHLESCIDLVGEMESALICFILAPFLRVTKHLYYFFCLIWDWRGEKKNWQVFFPLGQQTSEMRKEESGSWNKRKNPRMHAGIRPTKEAQTHTCKRLHFDTHVWECVARSHRQRCYRQCKHVWRCVLNTHYRGLGKLWERLGEKTNKPHRVFERGGKGSGGFSMCNSSSITDLSPQSNSGFTVLLRQITCAVTLQLWILYTSTEALSQRG